MAVLVAMISLGCPKNQVDAEAMLAALAAEGFTVTDDVAAADAVVVNTCGFIEDARREAVETILETAELKRTGRLRALVVTGCLAERYRDEILSEMPEVDAVLSLGRNGEIAAAIRRALGGERLGLYGSQSTLPLCGERRLLSPPYTAYLKIAEGCNNRCAYCAIPAIRGPLRSRPLGEAVEEAQSLAAAGVRELVVVAQDTTRYGEDLYGECRLPELLRALCQIEGLHWVRLLYAYPDRITSALCEVLQSEPKMVKYLDLPLQHCCGRVLRSMNRPGDRASLTACIARLRQAVPGITLRTTVMVGFPGETEEEFNELCDFVREMRFERLGCFAFSEEEGTPAATLPGAIPPRVRLRRQEILTEQQSFLLRELTGQKVGRQLEALVEGYDSARGRYVCRTAADAPEIDCKAYVASPVPLIPGQFVPVRVTGTDELDLLAELEGPPQSN